MTDSCPPILPTDIDALIFDLGGVILHLNYRATIAALSQALGQDVTAYYTQAQQNHVFDQYERGEISTFDFYSMLIRLLPNNQETLLARLDDPTFFTELEAGWNAMLLDIPDENLHLLRSLKTSVPIYLLSNTNESHLKQFRLNYFRDHGAQHGDFDALFSRAYYSHEMGLRKPEAEIFARVIADNGLRAQRTLFIDDNQGNLNGAASVGLRTVSHPTNAALAPRFSW